MNLGTLLYTWWYGILVGKDDAGNRYYRRHQRGRRQILNGRERRWVVYNGAVEASRVPPQWHGWLHHIVDKPPTQTPVITPDWGRDHQPNATGTAQAYRPPGYAFATGHTRKGTGGYEPWQPPEGPAKKG